MCKQADNIKKDHKVSGYEGVDCSPFTGDRPVADFVNTVINSAFHKREEYLDQPMDYDFLN